MSGLPMPLTRFPAVGYLLANAATLALGLALVMVTLVRRPDEVGGIAMFTALGIALIRAPQLLALARAESRWRLVFILGLCVAVLLTTLKFWHQGRAQVSVYLIGLFPLMVASVNREPDGRRILSVAFMLAGLSCGVSAVWGLASAAGQRSGGIWDEITVFGMTCAMVLVGCAMGLLSHLHSPRRLVWLGGALVAATGAALGLAVSGSRGPMIAAALGLAWCGWHLWRQGRLGRRLVMAGLAASLVAAAVLAVQHGERFTDILRFVSVVRQGGTATGSEAERAMLWKAAPKLIADSPWIGHGPRSIGPKIARMYQGQPSAPPEQYIRDMLYHMHDEWLDVAVSFGLPAFVLWLAWQITFVRALLRLPASGTLRAGLVGSACAVWIGIALVDTPMHWARLAFAGLALLALAASREPAAQGRSSSQDGGS